MSKKSLWVQDLLHWYQQHKRILPWRYQNNETPNPYYVWLSEIMLQQTVAKTVIPYFINFTTKWKTIHQLSTAQDEDIMTAWAGLGYYARARNLLECARYIVKHYDGVFPNEESELLKLKGIGPYTAAAIISIAFNKPAAPVDGNIERVISRIYAIKTPIPALNKKVKEITQNLIPKTQSSDFTQSMMDLGSMICKPKNPHCSDCPVQQHCLVYQQGNMENFPYRRPKQKKPNRSGTVYWLETQSGDILMTRRPNKGLLGGMLMFPSKGWDKNHNTTLPDLLPDIWTQKIEPLQITHVFTHFKLTLTIKSAIAPSEFMTPNTYRWIKKSSFEKQAIPSVMKKVITALNENSE